MQVFNNEPNWIGRLVNQQVLNNQDKERINVLAAKVPLQLRLNIGRLDKNDEQMGEK